jgi:hypothetical protein
MKDGGMNLAKQEISGKKIEKHLKKKIKNMKNDKEEQKQHLIDIMKDDENLRLYEESKLSALETIQSEVIEIQSEMIEKYKKITELDKEHIFYLEKLVQTQEKLISNLKHQVELLEKLYL